MAQILVIDDEPHIRKTLALSLEDEGHRVTAVGNARDAVAATMQQVFDVAFLDLRLDADSGLDVLPELLEQQPHCKVIVITAYASIETAVEAMKLGATDYLPKPFSPNQVRVVAQKAAEHRALERKIEVLQETARQNGPEALLDSRSPAMERVITLAHQVAGSDATVLIRGESGTGKGVIARAIHAWSGRAEQPFVTVHCPSLSADLLESELFGHAKGAFTGAVKANPGRVSQAAGGTLLLDEVADLPLGLQPRLLRFIQEHEYERVGDPVTRHADVRIVAATNQDLETAVEEGSFREDLLYRLNVIELLVPPLRERPEDIMPLAERFLAFFRSKYNQKVADLTSGAKTMLRRHSWPGNVRELQNAVERAVILCQGEQITANQLPLAESNPRPVAPEIGQMVTLEELERSHIRRIIDTTETLEEAAQTLGIDSTTLWRRRKRYGI